MSDDVVSADLPNFERANEAEAVLEVLRGSGAVLLTEWRDGEAVTTRRVALTGWKVTAAPKAVHSRVLEITVNGGGTP